MTAWLDEDECAPRLLFTSDLVLEPRGRARRLRVASSPGGAILFTLEPTDGGGLWIADVEVPAMRADALL